MKSLYIFALLLAVPGLLWAVLPADPFQALGLAPAACVITDKSMATLEEAREVLKLRGARALHIFPPDVIFGRFPEQLAESDLGGLSVEIVRSPGELLSVGLDPIKRKVLSDLFREKEILEDYEPPEDITFNDPVLRVPDEVIAATSRVGPRTGSTFEITSRNANQNSEFMIGTVAINIIYPESVGGSEDWTDDELAGALSGIVIGLSQYQQKALWVDLDFKYKQFKRVYVLYEPIEGDMSTDPIWMGQALKELGYSESMWEAHRLNNDTRAEFAADWVFTAFIVDASNNECWQGPGAGYVAYSYVGGPLLVVPYPACRFGDGVGFSHVFIHEMSHSFWALDEYASYEGPCGELAGYLAIPNLNNVDCNPGQTGWDIVPCIMNNAELSLPLPICRWTLAQVGLADEDEDDYPDIYQVEPTLEFLDVGIGDTIYENSYCVAAEAKNEAVSNMNPWQHANWLPEQIISYAPWLKKGEVAINDNLFAEFKPTDGKWDSSREMIGYFETGFIPGMNTLWFRVTNNIGLEAVIDKVIYYIGIKYYYAFVDVQTDYMELTWLTAAEIFGAVFDVMRIDLTMGGVEVVLDTIVDPIDYEPGDDTRQYGYTDESIVPGHTYRYRVVGRFELKGEWREYPSGSIERTAIIPVGSNLVSTLLPNPTPDQTTFTVNVPKTYFEPSGTATDRGSFGTPAQIQEQTPVEISVFNVKGQRIKTLYSGKIFGGLMTLSWKGVDKYGRKVTPGVYFIRIEAGGNKAVKKVVILY